VTDLDWLAELSFLQRHPDSRISDLGDAWDRYLDDVLHERRGDIEPASAAEEQALLLIHGLLEEDHQESIHAMRAVLTGLDGDDTVAVVLVLLQILMHQIGVDHNDPEYGHVGVGEPDYAGLAELDGDDIVDVALVVLRILRHIIGDHHEAWRSRIRTRLGVNR
jgi:hypothetical protein